MPDRTEHRVAMIEDDRRVTLFVLHELRFTLSQAKGYIRSVSEERKDGGGSIVREIEERLSELNALTDRLRRGVSHV